MASTKSHKIRNLLQKGLTPTEVVARLKVSRSTVYRIRSEMVEDGLLDIISLQPTKVKTPKPKPKPKLAPKPKPKPKPVPVQEVVKPKTLWQSMKEWFK